MAEFDPVALYSVNVLAGPVASVTIADGGAGYPVSSSVRVTIPQTGSKNNAVIDCTTDGDGIIVSVDSIVSAGNGYVPGNGLSSSPSEPIEAPATGATFNLVSVTPGTGNNITTSVSGWIKALSLTPGSAAATLVVADAATVTGSKLWHLQAQANGRTAFVNLGKVGAKFDTGLSYTLVGTGAVAEIFYALV